MYRTIADSSCIFHAKGHREPPNVERPTPTCRHRHWHWLLFEFGACGCHLSVVCYIHHVNTTAGNFGNLRQQAKYGTDRKAQLCHHHSYNNNKRSSIPAHTTKKNTTYVYKKNNNYAINSTPHFHCIWFIHFIFYGNADAHSLFLFVQKIK